MLDQLVVLDEIDFDGGGVTELQYVAIAIRSEPVQPPSRIYNAGFSVWTLENCRSLRATAGRIPFGSDDVVSESSSEYTDSVGGNWIVFGRFGETSACEVCPWEYYDITPGSPKDFWKNRLEFFTGVRFPGEDGPHHGWLRFSRPNTHLTTGFELSAYDWNPLPGEPIAAGRPPVIPVFPEITPEGMLRLSWSPAVTTWPLEYCERLGPDAEWFPVPEAGGTEVVLPLPEGQRFYRLRRP